MLLASAIFEQSCFSAFFSDIEYTFEKLLNWIVSDIERKENSEEN